MSDVIDAMVNGSMVCSMSQTKRATWNDLATIYDKVTGGCARIKPMDTVFEWAEKQPELFKLNEDGSLTLTQKAEALEKGNE